MKSLLWKELRENAKWAMVPLILFAGSMAIYGPRPCMSEPYLMFVSLVGALFGGGLGLLQVAFESQGDRRALLLHRPLSRSRIFLAKAIAGAGLYLAAMGFPFAVNAVWTAMPGAVAEPFRWQILLPWVADILTGLVYYFAGLLAAQRQGSWFGGRCLGFPAAFLCSWLVWNLPEFWHALAAIVLFGGLTAVTAWGSFLTGGEDARQPLWAKVALAGTFLSGLTALSVIGKLVVASLIATGESPISKYYFLDRGGRVLVGHEQLGQDYRLTDLAGRELPEFQLKQRADSGAAAMREIMAPLTRGTTPKVQSYRMPGRFYVSFWNETCPKNERWFYVVDQGRLIGFDIRRRLIGSLGPDGFARAGEQAAGRFQGELDFISVPRAQQGAQDYLAFPGAAFAVDFPRRAVTKLLTPAAGEKVLWAQRCYDERRDVALAFVCTDRSLHVVHEDGRALFAAPLAFDRKTYGLVHLAQVENPERLVVWYAPSSLVTRTVAMHTLPMHFLEYDLAGHELGRQTVPALPLDQTPASQPWFGVATPLSEAALLLGTTREPLCTLWGDAESVLWYHLFGIAYRIFPDPVELHDGPFRGRVLGYWMLILVNATISATICFLLARRFAFSRGRYLAWSLCGLLFGLCGLLLMLAIEQWPARILCHACHKRRVVTRDTCEHCDAAQAPPAMDGTEIFESGAVAPRTAPASY